jgi:hypothetical protein
MNRTGVAEVVGEEWQHRFEDRGVHGGRGVVIEISAHFLEAGGSGLEAGKGTRKSEDF